MMVLWVVLALTFLGLQQGTVTSSDRTSAEQRASLERERHRQAANEINDLAARIHSEADAVAFVDKIAEFFADTLPPIWVTRSVRQQVAHAEFEAVSNPSRLIPEQRVADVWNKYVREIGASEEALVTAAEIHNLRDADFAISQLWWSRTNLTIWTMPNVYAVGSDGKVAEGCRAVETLRVLYDLDKLFDNLRGARDRVRKGILFSDEIRKRLDSPASKQKTTARLEARVDTNPLRPAEYRYMQEHGPYILSGVMEKLFDELFPQAE
jgi:hypothetical protein